MKKNNARFLCPADDFQAETHDEFEKRYAGFGKDIYLHLKEHLPEVFRQLRLFRQIKVQTEDSYAEYTADKIDFAIQLDPLIEVIVLWNKQHHFEIGTWSENEYEEAIERIKSYFLSEQNIV